MDDAPLSENPLSALTVSDARQATMILLERRSREATVCPSEVARALTRGADAALTAEDWRLAMPVVHAAIDDMVAEKLITLSWKGQVLPTRAGPYRIGRRTDV